MKYKVIFCDFDGTLYRDDHTISLANVNAVDRFTQSGGKFVVATGRLFESILPHLRALNLHGEVIVKQGSSIIDIDSGEVKSSWTFSQKLAMQCAGAIDNNPDCVGMVYIDDECYASHDSDFVKLFAKICNISYHIVDMPLQQYIADGTKRIFKFIALVDKEKATSLAKVFDEQVSGVNICRSSDNILEFLPIGVNKGSAMLKVCDEYGILADDVIAMGDSENDMSMIKLAGLGIAVGNAFDCVKNVAKYISETNDNDAVAHVVDKFCVER